MIPDTWASLLAGLTSDELVELDRLVYAARLLRDAKVLCDDSACNCRAEAR